jgi:hypothetical protein
VHATRQAPLGRRARCVIPMPVTGLRRRGGLPALGHVRSGDVRFRCRRSRILRACMLAMHGVCVGRTLMLPSPACACTLQRYDRILQSLCLLWACSCMLSESALQPQQARPACCGQCAK